jgi:hypothetical protein
MIITTILKGKKMCLKCKYTNKSSKEFKNILLENKNADKNSISKIKNSNLQ